METMSSAALDGWLEDLHRVHPSWKEMSQERRLRYLRQLRQDTYRVAPRWVEVCCQLKGVDPNSVHGGQEWAVGPMITLRNMRLLERQITLPTRVGSRVVRSLPEDRWDLLQWPIFRGETWSQEGLADGPAVRDKVGLVLGAGNVSSISATDVLYKMFIENQVVLLKMNPVHEALGPVLEEAFACLIQDGYLRIVAGGAAEGALACSHPKVEALHITGSHHTYAAIRKSVGPDKPMTSELGCVSPVIIAPGRWSPRQLRFQARHVAAMLTTNAGFNCNAAQVLVTCRSWPQRKAFLDEVRRALSKVAARPAYYPGACQRHQQILQRYPQAEQLGPPADSSVSWTLVADLDPEVPQSAFQEEAFCGTLFETSLEALDSEFLLRAADFVNEKLWGNLSCSMLISPSAQQTQPWRRALELLRYGAIGVNVWPGFAFALVNLPWGAYPGNGEDDIQSGRGFVHNTANVGKVEKAILQGPFYLPLTTPWQSNFLRMLPLARALTRFEYQPDWKSLARCHWEILRGGLGM